MIFVDIGAWIAISDKSDKYHWQAIRIYTEIGFTGLPISVTAYYKRLNGQVLLWGMNEFNLYAVAHTG